MVYCYECVYFEHCAGLDEGRPFEYFLCGAQKRPLDKRFVDKDLYCGNFAAKFTEAE